MEITPLPTDLHQKVMDSYPGRFEGYVQVGPQKWLLPNLYEKHAKSIRNAEVYPSDVWVGGVPRSGTTMMQEIVWLLTHNLDYETAKSVNSYNRILSFEAPVLFGPRRVDFEKASMDAYDSFKEAGAHRVIKSHLPFCLCPSNLFTCGAKIIYVVRYVKDVVKSTYILNRFKGPFEEFWDLFENNLRLFNPFWEHVKQGLEQANNENVLIVCYEDVVQNPTKELAKMSKFLGQNYSDKEIDSLRDFMNYDKFKTTFTNSTDTHAGIIGKQESWKQYFPDELDRRANKWIEENGKKIDFWNLKYGQY